MSLNNNNNTKKNEGLFSLVGGLLWGNNNNNNNNNNDDNRTQNEQEVQDDEEQEQENFTQVSKEENEDNEDNNNEDNENEDNEDNMNTQSTMPLTDYTLHTQQPPPQPQNYDLTENNLNDHTIALNKSSSSSNNNNSNNSNNNTTTNNFTSTSRRNRSHRNQEEDIENSSVAPSDFDNQCHFSQVDDESIPDRPDGIFYQGQLIHKMPYRELASHLKALGIKASGKKEVLIANLEAVVQSGGDKDILTPIDEIRTPKRKRNTDNSPGSQTKRTSTRILGLQTASIKKPTRVSTGRRTANSTKDSYISTLRDNSPPKRTGRPGRPRRHPPKQTHEKTHDDDDVNDDNDHEQNNYNLSAPESDVSYSQGYSQGYSQNYSQNYPNDQNHNHIDNTNTNNNNNNKQDNRTKQKQQQIQIHQEDNDSELDGYYSSEEYNPRSKIENNSKNININSTTTTTTIAATTTTTTTNNKSNNNYNFQVPSTPEGSIPNSSHFESTGKFDYEDMTDSVSVVETASVAATNGSALSPLHINYLPENGPLSTISFDQLPPPQKYPQYSRNRNHHSSQISDLNVNNINNNNNNNNINNSINNNIHIIESHNHHLDDDVSSVTSFPDPNSLYSSLDNHNLSLNHSHSHNINRSRISSASSASIQPTHFEDALGAVGNRFISMLRGEGPELSEAEYTFFKALLESKRITKNDPLLPQQSTLSTPTAQQQISTNSIPTTTSSTIDLTVPPTSSEKKVIAIDTCVQTDILPESEDYERKKRTFDESETTTTINNNNNNNTTSPKLNNNEDNNLQSNKKRRGQSPNQVYPSFQSNIPPIRVGLFSDSERDYTSSSRINNTYNSFSLPSSTPTPSIRTETSFSSSFTRSPVSSSRFIESSGTVPVSLQIQQQTLPQSNQTSALSSVQRRLMRRRSSLNSNNNNDININNVTKSNSSNTNGIVAKKILDALGEINTTLSEKRKPTITYPSSFSSTSPTIQTNNETIVNKVRFKESPSTEFNFNSKSSVIDRKGTPKPLQTFPTPSSTRSSFDRESSSRDSIESTEQLWTREKSRAGGPSMSPSLPPNRNLLNDENNINDDNVKKIEQPSFIFNTDKKFNNYNNNNNNNNENNNNIKKKTITIDKEKNDNNNNNDNGDDEFTFKAPRDIEGLEDETFSPQIISNKEVQFVFSPPAKKITKKYPTTPGGVKVKLLATAEKQNNPSDKKINLNNDSNKNFNDSSNNNNNNNTIPSETPKKGFPEALLKRPNQIKCPDCMVYNDKSAPKCVACGCVFDASKSGSASSAPASSSSSTISSKGFTFGAPSNSNSNNATATTTNTNTDNSQKSSGFSFGGSSKPVTTISSTPSTGGFTFGGATTTPNNNKSNKSDNDNDNKSNKLETNNNNTNTNNTSSSSSFSFGSTPKTTVNNDEIKSTVSFKGFSSTPSTLTNLSSESSTLNNENKGDIPSKPTNFSFGSTPSTSKTVPSFSLTSTQTSSSDGTGDKVSFGFNKEKSTDISSNTTTLPKSNFSFGGFNTSKSADSEKPVENSTIKSSTTFGISSTPSVTNPTSTPSFSGFKPNIQFGNTSTNPLSTTTPTPTIISNNNSVTSEKPSFEDENPTKKRQMKEDTEKKPTFGFSSTIGIGNNSNNNSLGSTTPSLSIPPTNNISTTSGFTSNLNLTSNFGSTTPSTQLSAPTFKFDNSNNNTSSDLSNQTKDENKKINPFGTSSSITTPSTNSGINFNFSSNSTTNTFGGSSLGTKPFGLQSTPALPTTPGLSAPKFGSITQQQSSTSTPGMIFGKTQQPTFGLDQSQQQSQSGFNRTSSLTTPPPPPPFGSESPGTMDTGYSGDTNSVPTQNLPPAPFGSSFNTSAPLSMFGSSTPSMTFGASSSTSSKPISTPNLSAPFSFNSQPPSSGFSFGAVNPINSGSSGSFAGFGANNNNNNNASGSTFSLSNNNNNIQTFGQTSNLSMPGGGAPMFNIGAAEKNPNQKNRKKLKSQWKPQS